MVDVTHHRDDRRTGLGVGTGCGIEQLVEAQLALQLDLLLLAGVDEADVRPDLRGEQLDHVVGQRLGRGDHLALLHEEADDVGCRAVELGAEVLRGRGALDHDRALGDRGRRRRVARRLHRLELLAAATPATAPPRRALPTTGTATGASTTGTTARTTATGAAEATTGTTAAATTEGTATAATTAGAATRTTAPGRAATGATAARRRGTTPTQTGRGRDRLARQRGGRAGRRRDRLARRRGRCTTTWRSAGRRGAGARPTRGRGARARGAGCRSARAWRAAGRGPGRASRGRRRGATGGRRRGARRASRRRTLGRAGARGLGGGRRGGRCGRTGGTGVVLPAGRARRMVAARRRDEPPRRGRRRRRPASRALRRRRGRHRRARVPPVLGRRALGRLGRRLGGLGGLGVVAGGRAGGFGRGLALRWGGGRLGLGGRRLGLGGGRAALARLVRLLGTDQAVALGATADAVGLRLLDARGVRLHPDAQIFGEIEGFFVRHPELFRELVDPDLRCQSCL